MNTKVFETIVNIKINQKEKELIINSEVKLLRA